VSSTVPGRALWKQGIRTRLRNFTCRARRSKKVGGDPPRGLSGTRLGDVDGHLISVGRFSGLASFPDGTVGTTYFVFVTDYIKGSGTFWTHNNLTLNDGSVLWYKLKRPRCSA
jgi:hypothetical protein